MDKGKTQRLQPQLSLTDVKGNFTMVLYTTDINHHEVTLTGSIRFRNIQSG